MKNISLTQISIEEFRGIIREEVQRVQALQTSIPEKEKNLKEIMGVEEVVEYLGIKRSAIYHKTHLGTIPYFKKGKKLYFRKSELDLWIESGRQKTVQQEIDNIDRYLKNYQKK